ncbi:MAG: hypothetical protein R2710_07915 [Acidimicrobiales bacterium]
MSVPAQGAIARDPRRDAGLVENSRVIMEKPFGTDLASAKALNETVHEVFDEEQVFRIPTTSSARSGAQHLGVPLCQRSVRTDLAPQHDRSHPDRHPRGLGTRAAANFYESTGAYRDMVVTICSR